MALVLPYDKSGVRIWGHGADVANGWILEGAIRAADRHPAHPGQDLPAVDRGEALLVVALVAEGT
jgi:hypothetical protein